MGSPIPSVSCLYKGRKEKVFPPLQVSLYLSKQMLNLTVESQDLGYIKSTVIVPDEREFT